MEVKISIIVPVYNVEDYLVECLQSILFQTYKNIEVILIDDGSTDGSGEICEEYQKKDKRIKAAHQTNQGLSAARNKGIQMATGEYLMFVDSDDYIHSRTLEILYSAMQNVNAEISICAHKKVDDFIEIEKEKLNEYETQLFSGRECVRMLYSQNVVDMVIACNKLFKKEYFDKISFPVGKINEDEFVTYQILYPLNRCVYIKAELYYYRQRSGSITNKKSSIKVLDKLDAYRERIRFFEEKEDKELYSITLWKYLRCLIASISYVEENFPKEEKILENLNVELNFECEKVKKEKSLSYGHRIFIGLARKHKKTYCFLKNTLERQKRKRNEKLYKK